MDQGMLELRILKGVCPLDQSQETVKRQGRNTHQNTEDAPCFRTYALYTWTGGRDAAYGSF